MPQPETRTADALALLASLVLEDGARWGEKAEPWQWDDARAILDPRPPNMHYLTRPRGASKTGDLGGIAIAALLTQMLPGSRSYGLAADRDQGALLLDSVQGFRARTPGLADVLHVGAWKMLAGSASLEIMAADDASAWGIRPYMLIVDEFAQWKSTPGPRRLWRAVFSALPKVRGSRLVVLTSAGDPAHWSHDVLKRAKSSTRWRVHEVPGPCPWILPDDLEEQRNELPPWEFSRLHLNRWTEGDEHLTTVADLESCVTLAGPLEPQDSKSYVIGIDLGLKRDRTAVVVAHAEPRPEAEPGSPAVTVTLDRIAVWQGTRSQPVDLAEVEAFVLEAHQRYNRAPIVCDPWQAAMLVQRLRARGVSIHEEAFTQQSVGRLAQTLHALLRDHALALPRNEALLEELANVRIRETGPGVFRLDHDPDKHDDMAIALALAARPLLERAGRTRPPVRARSLKSRHDARRRMASTDDRDAFGRARGAN